MTELKPCPFCGAEGIITLWRNGAEFMVHQPVCSRCSATIGASTDYSDAITAWNTRAKSPEYEKLLAFVKDICSNCGDFSDEAKELLKEIGENA